MSHPFNVFSREVIEDPYPLYAEMRRRSPVCQVEPNGWWAATRYEDVAFILKHPDLFSSSDLRPARDSLLEVRLQGDAIFPDNGSIIASK